MGVPTRGIGTFFNVAQLIVINLVITLVCLSSAPTEARKQMPLLIDDDTQSRLNRPGEFPNKSNFIFCSVIRNQFCNRFLRLSLMDSLLMEIKWAMTRVLKTIKTSEKMKRKKQTKSYNQEQINRPFCQWKYIIRNLVGRKFVWLSHIINLWRHQINNIHDADINCKNYVLTIQRIFMNTFNRACAHIHTYTGAQSIERKNETRKKKQFGTMNFSLFKSKTLYWLQADCASHVE